MMHDAPGVSRRQPRPPPVNNPGRMGVIPGDEDCLSHVVVSIPGRIQGRRTSRRHPVGPLGIAQLRRDGPGDPACGDPAGHPRRRLARGLRRPTAFAARDGTRATFSVDYSYVGPGQAKFQGDNQGNSEAQSVNASLAGAVALNDKWFVPLGVSSADFFLNSLAGAPIPDEVNTLRLLGGLGYNINRPVVDRRQPGAGALPAERPGHRRRGAGRHGPRPLALAAQPDAGLWRRLRAGSRYPGPARRGPPWNIRTNLALNLMFPRPMLIYLGRAQAEPLPQAPTSNSPCSEALRIWGQDSPVPLRQRAIRCT